MKMLSTLASILFTLPTFATVGGSHEVIHTTANVRMVSDLRCVQVLGSRNVGARPLTELATNDGYALFLVGPTPPLEMKHIRATAPGCDLPALDDLVDRTGQNFGFLLNAPIEIIKQTEPSRVNGRGECVTTYWETLRITILPQLVLESKLGELRDATDCPSP